MVLFVMVIQGKWCSYVVLTCWYLGIEMFYKQIFCSTYEICCPYLKNINKSLSPKMSVISFCRGVAALLTRSARWKGLAYYAHKHEIENAGRRVRVRSRTFVFPHMAIYVHICMICKIKILIIIIIILNCTRCRPFQVYIKTEKANF